MASMFSSHSVTIAQVLCCVYLGMPISAAAKKLHFELTTYGFPPQFPPPEPKAVVEKKEVKKEKEQDKPKKQGKKK